GLLNFAGGYSQTNAPLRFGLTSTTNYGSMAAPGALNIDGTLAVNLLNGYMPAIGDTFAPISFPSSVGKFIGLNFPPLAGGNHWQVSYLPTAVNLGVAAPGTNATYLISGTVKSTN